MNVKIGFDSTIIANDSVELTELANLIQRECSVLVQHEKQAPQQGVKDGGLTIAISIIGLTLSGIGTLISVLTYWQSQRPKYSISIKRGDVTFTLNDLPDEELSKTLELLKMQQASVNMEIQVASKEESNL